MTSTHPFRARMGRTRTLVGALAISLLGLSAVALAPPASADQDVVVSPTPDAQAPRIMNGRVYAIDTYGPLVAVGGSFTTIRPGASGADQTRQWLFMYNSTTGAISQTFVPQLSGPTPTPTNGLVKDQPGVEAIEFAPDGQSLYVGGWFTSVNGESRKRIVQLNLDGSIRPSFSADLNNTVSDMALVGDRLVIGGRFGQVNGQPVARLASLDPATGATQTDFNLPATDSRNQYASYVNEIDASDDGRFLAVSGSFRKIGNRTRQQVALIDLSTPRPSLANWSTDLYIAQLLEREHRLGLLHPRPGDLARQLLPRGQHHRRLHRRRDHVRHRGPLRAAADRDGRQPLLHVARQDRRRHPVGLRGHRRRRLRRRPPALDEQPPPLAGRRQRRSRLGRALRHRRPRPAHRRPALLEPRP